MFEPDVTLTDLALAVEFAAFAFVLFRRDPGNRRLTRKFAWLFAALCAASALGGTYHGFFSGTPSAAGRVIWNATLLALGAVGLCTWLVAGAIQLGRRGMRIVLAIAVAQFAAFAGLVAFVTQEFLLALLDTLPATLFLLLGYLRILARTGDRSVLLGLAGLVLAFLAAAQQQAGIGLHPVYLSHNALYHVLQGIALLLVFLSVKGLAAAIRPPGTAGGGA